MLYLKLVFSEFQHASRDKRELSVAEKLGYEIKVLATTKEAKNYNDFYDGYDIYRISTRRIGKIGWLILLNRALAFLDFIITVINSDADIISGHGYVATFAGYIANLFKKHKAKLIYDSHEFLLYQDMSNSRIKYYSTKLIEGFLIRRVDLVLMVGDKIADGVKEIYKMDLRPTVVRNIPSYWKLEFEQSRCIREKLIAAIGLPKDGFLLMYHGGIIHGRGIECAIRALALLPKDIGLVIMGPENQEGMIEYLRGIAEEKGIAQRVFFHPAVSVIELKDYIGAVNVELVLQSAWCINVLYSLPNKFFESIQSCVPLICCDLPEMGKIVRRYDIGLLVKEDDEKSVAEAIIRLREDKVLYERLRRNMEKAKEELCWEKESLKLRTAIQEMMEK